MLVKLVSAERRLRLLLDLRACEPHHGYMTDNFIQFAPSPIIRQGQRVVSRDSHRVEEPGE